MKWFKQTSLDRDTNTDTEIWIRGNNNSEEKFPVNVFLGKKTDLLGLKKNIVESLKDKVDYYQKSRKKIYHPDNLEEVKACPVCQSSAEDTIPKVDIYGASYAECQGCSHVYVINRPNKTAIEGFYLNDITYAATYTDRKSAEIRMNAIAVPWRDWVIEVYKKQYGRAPKKILDVGSGAGHFVKACRDIGLEANGIELSQSSRDFAREIWNIELDGRDFTKVVDEYAGYDIVTFWGLLEHTPNPGTILDGAAKIIESSGNGMVISKVPRWNSLSSAIQRLSSDTIIRHLDPMGHIMCFTDSSASELYYRSGLKPCAAWYYGMDVYELLMQIGHKIDNYDSLTRTGGLQMELQQFIDNITFSDGLTLVGIPK